MIEDGEYFDFEKWASSSVRPTFGSCIRGALNCLALGDEELRHRLGSALFCILRAVGSDVPLRLRPAFDELVNYVVERAGNHPLWIDTRKLTKRMKYKTVRRLSRQLVWLYEQAADAERGNAQAGSSGMRDSSLRSE